MNRLSSHTQKRRNKIKNFNVNSKDVIGSYVEILLNSDIHCFVLKGPPGIGKTTAVLDKLNKLKLEEGVSYLYMTGYITPLSLYETFQQTRLLDKPKLLVCDDLDAILKNKTALGLMKSALSEANGKRVVSYQSKSSWVAEQNFNFEGKIILIANEFTKNSAIEPLLDRGIYYDMTSDKLLMKAYIEEHLDDFGDKIDFKIKDEIWQKVRRFIDFPTFSFRALNRAFLFHKANPENWYSLWSRTMKRK